MAGWQRRRIAFESPRSAMRAGPVDCGERESNGDVGAEALASGSAPTGATMVAAAAGQCIEERLAGDRDFTFGFDAHRIASTVAVALWPQRTKAVFQYAALGTWITLRTAS